MVASYVPDHFTLDQAAGLLHTRFVPRYMDRKLYGHGRWDEAAAKFRPIHANPKKGAFPHYVEALRGCVARQLDAHKIRHHVAGSWPMFLVNIAHTEAEVWRSDLEFYDLLHTLGIGQSHSFDQIVQLIDDSLDGKRTGLSISSARKLLRTPPDSEKAKKLAAKIRGENLLAEVQHALLAIGHEPASGRVVRRALERAIRKDFVARREHEIVVDIDADKSNPSAAAASLAMAERIREDLFHAFGYYPFIEPSRNGHGAYVRVRVRRETLDVTAYNRLICDFRNYLKFRYSGKRDDGACWVDKVAGLLANREENPDFDEELYYHHEDWQDPCQLCHGERYLWRKGRHGLVVPSRSPYDKPKVVHWEYDKRLERYHLPHAGDLITLPLHHVLSDPDRGVGRVNRFAVYMAAPDSVVPESHLRSLIARDAEFRAFQARQTKTSPAEQLVIDEPRPDLGVSNSVSGDPLLVSMDMPDVSDLVQRFGRCHDLEIFVDEGAEQHARYGAGARLLLRERGIGDPAQLAPSLLALVERPDGPATGPRHPERVSHARRCLGHWASRFDTSVRSRPAGVDQGPWFNLEDHLRHAEQLVRCRISRAMIREVEARRSRARVDYRVLAHAWLVMMKNIHTGNATQVPSTSIRNALKHFGLAASTGTVAAIVDLLTHPAAGLLVRVGEACTLPGHGRCRSFVLDPKCPIPGWLTAAVPMVWVAGKTWGLSASGTAIAQPIPQKTTCQGDTCTSRAHEGPAAAERPQTRAGGNRQRRGVRFQPGPPSPLPLRTSVCGAPESDLDSSDGSNLSRIPPFADDSRWNLVPPRTNPKTYHGTFAPPVCAN